MDKGKKGESETEHSEDKLKYYYYPNIPIWATGGAVEKLGMDLVRMIGRLVMKNAQDMRAENIEPDYLKVLEVKNIRGKVVIAVYQEEPKHLIAYKCDVDANGFTGRVYVKEAWNGVPPEDATMDDHYITIYLPGED